MNPTQNPNNMSQVTDSDILTRLRQLLREDPNMQVSQVRKALSLPSDTVARTLMTQARAAETAVAEELVQAEKNTSERAFFLKGENGHLIPLRYVSDNGTRVIFKAE